MLFQILRRCNLNPEPLSTRKPEAVPNFSMAAPLRGQERSGEQPLVDMGRCGSLPQVFLMVPY